MDVSCVFEASGRRPSEEPAVLVRLFLMAVDEVTGEQRLVSSFIRKISMPAILASPEVKVALEIHGERHVFTPTDVVWDEAQRVCIVEVVWLIADDASVADAEEAWPMSRSC
jgi:hypothetical protein